MAARAQATANTYSSKLAKEVIGEIEDLDDKIASAKASNAKRCRDLMEKKKTIFERAQAKGIPLKPLKVEIKSRSLDRQKARLIAGLENEERDQLANLQQSLGDLASTPLGQAAIKAAETEIAES